MNELGILRVHLIRLKNKNENLQESKKTRIRTLVNLVASESFAHYANKTFQVRFFLLCVFISSLLDICTKTGLYIISISFIFFFLIFTSQILFFRNFLIIANLSNYRGKTERGTSSIKTTNYRYNEAKQDCPFFLYQIKPDSISLRIKIRGGFSPQSRAIHSFVYRRAFRGCLRMFLDSNLTRSVEQSRRSFLFVPLAESGRETGNRFKPGNFSTLPSWFYQKLFFPAFFHSLAGLKYSSPRKIKMEWEEKYIYISFLIISTSNFYNHL